nr:MAG TPA: tail tape measure [Caudoviricetes sp.]
MGIYSAINLIKGAFSAVSGAMSFTDEYTTANARLSLINDGLRTQKELQEDIAASASRSRASYSATAKLVTGIGMSGAMKSTKEAVEFSEKINKLLVIGGGGAAQNEAALLQLSQALTSGVLQGDEYRSLRENAPALMKEIASGLGVSMGSLKEMSTAGLLTSDAIIKAMEKAGTSIDTQFNKMPLTFSQNLQAMKDKFGFWAASLAEDGALKNINDIFRKFNVYLSSDAGTRMLSNIGLALNIAATALLFITNGLGYFMGLLEHIYPIADILFFTVLIAGAILASQALWTMVPPLIASAGAFIMMNLPIILIAAGIAGLIMILRHFGVSANDIVSFVGGLIGGLATHILNQGIFIKNVLLSVAEFFANIFIDPAYAVKKLFYDITKEISGFFTKMINGLIDGINFLIKKSNKIAKTDFKSINYIEAKTFAKPKASKNVVNLDKYKSDYISYQDGALKGAGILSDGLKKASSLKDSAFGNGEISGIKDIDKVGKVGKIDSDVNIAKEDIKYLLDAVTQKYVNNINLTVETKAPVINNSAVVREEADIEKLKSVIADAIYEQTVVSV